MHVSNEITEMSELKLYDLLIVLRQLLSSTNEKRHEKTCLHVWGFRSGPTQTELGKVAECQRS